MIDAYSGALLKGQVAVLAGAVGGIGRAIAERLAGDGADLALIDMDASQLAIDAETLRDRGTRTEWACADITDRESVRAALKFVEATLGSPSILVNAVGISPQAEFLEVGDADWDRTIRINLTGAYILGQETARLMAPLARGHIIYLSSLSARVGHGQQAAYASSKGGVEALVRAMAVDLAKYDITVNAVAPGTVLTDLNRATLSDDDRARRLERTPRGRFTERSEVADIVAFLASPAASAITGQSIAADAGFHITGVVPALP